MNPFVRLLRSARQQHEENHFPAELLGEVQQLVANADALAGREAQIAELAARIEDFDPYAGTGCFGEAASAAEIAALLKRLRTGIFPAP